MIKRNYACHADRKISTEKTSIKKNGACTTIKDISLIIIINNNKSVWNKTTVKINANRSLNSSYTS